MSERKGGPGSVSIYTIMANLFAEIAQEVTGRFGAEGEEAIRQAVRSFGRKRGQTIAASVEKDGKEKGVGNYLPYYDMERSGLFKAENRLTEGQLEQDFSECIFAKTWMDAGMEKYGLFYCEEIDPAIARGYNPNFQCYHDKHFLKGDKHCRFIFRMEKDLKKE